MPSKKKLRKKYPFVPEHKRAQAHSKNKAYKKKFKADWKAREQRMQSGYKPGYDIAGIDRHRHYQAETQRYYEHTRGMTPAEAKAALQNTRSNSAKIIRIHRKSLQNRGMGGAYRKSRSFKRWSDPYSNFRLLE